MPNQTAMTQRPALADASSRVNGSSLTCPSPVKVHDVEDAACKPASPNPLTSSSGESIEASNVGAHISDKSFKNFKERAEEYHNNKCLDEVLEARGLRVPKSTGEVSQPKPAAPGATTSASGAKATPVGASSGRKRKAETSLEDDIAAYKQNLNDKIDPASIDYDHPLTDTQIRARIHKLLDSGIMTKTEFCDATHTTNQSLNKFLSKTGTSTLGRSEANVAWSTNLWFQQREAAGLKFPDVKKRQKQGAEPAAGAAASSTPGSAKSSRSTQASKNSLALPDLSSVHLDGEDEDKVPVWDTCDEIRRKIDAHLKTPGLTQAQFCRDIYSQLKVPKCKGIQSKQLADFRSLKGPRAGTKSSVYYGAYVFFEKLRIAQGKPKNKHRETMEDEWGFNGGFDIERDHRTGYLYTADFNKRMNQYGKFV